MNLSEELGLLIKMSGMRFYSQEAYSHGRIRQIGGKRQ